MLTASTGVSLGRHFTPMKPWLAHLSAAGHDVLVVGPPDLADAAAARPFQPDLVL